MKTIYTLFTIICCSALLAEIPFHTISLEEACQRAQEQKKIIMIDFYTTWCGPCKKLDRTTWKDATVQQWLERHTIALKIDAEKQKDLAKKLNVKAYPSIIFVDEKQKENGRIVGYRDAKRFIEEAQGIIDGKSPLARAKEALEKAGKDLPMNVMRYAKALEEAGYHEKALEKYLWCFDHGLEKQPSFAGVRLSFLLGYISHLGKEYPLAITALQKRCDDLQTQIQDQTIQLGAVRDFFALSEELDQIERAMEVYNHLQQSPVKKELGDCLFKTLLKARRYRDIAKNLPNVVDKAKKLIQRYEVEERNPRYQKMPSLLQTLKKMYIADIAQHYEVLLGINKDSEAQQVAQLLIEFDDSEKTRLLLIKHTQNAGRPDAAKHFLK